MAVTIKTPNFTNRVVEHPNRYTLTNVSGTTYDLARSEGTVTTNGTPQSEATFNKIKTDLDALNANIGTIETNGIIGTTQFGATTVTNLNAIAKCGFYECNTSATGVPPSVPTNTKWLVLHQNNNTSGTDYKYQRATSLAPGDAITYERTSVAGWNDWKLVPNDADITNLKTGWLPANETWTYASVDDPTGNVTITGDVTSKYSPGMRIKFTNGGNTIYGIITKIAYSSPNTILTFLHEINTTTGNTALYLMADSAIINNYISCSKSPCGFPINRKKWTFYYKDNTSQSQLNPSQNIWYNIGTTKFDIPIGLWKYGYEVNVFCNYGTATSISMFTTLSTSNNSVSNATLTNVAETNPVTTFNLQMSKSDDVNLTAKTTHYLLGRTGSSALTQILFYGNNSTTTLYAECAYL